MEVMKLAIYRLVSSIILILLKKLYTYRATQCAHQDLNNRSGQLHSSQNVLEQGSVHNTTFIAVGLRRIFRQTYLNGAIGQVWYFTHLFLV